MDLVLASEDRVIPLEIKMRGEIKARDAKPLFRSMARYGIKKGYIISSELEATFDDGGRTVEVLPYWRHWSIRRRITS